MVFNHIDGYRLRHSHVADMPVTVSSTSYTFRCNQLIGHLLSIFAGCCQNIQTSAVEFEQKNTPCFRVATRSSSK
ncbi:MAG: hypothetical protein J07HQW2_02459 [Haloquadratum walsbyi J07HQW2]|uniref:Uncharacterized protein n=1 Tax=Haloquadratum walsbyi J07HQW2 TaxID=1238425 RepID=U1NFX2_9EURY|nr:MAG: hypothetical protein J07HQW2_02459 [Haloquadratum walsbyi J07HQW2]